MKLSIERFILNLTFLFLIGCAGDSISSTEKNIPSLNIKTLNTDSTLNLKTLNTGRPLLVFIFSPDCVHCNAITKQITENMSMFTNYELLMVSPYASKEIRKFYTSFNLARFKNVTVGSDSLFVLPFFYKISSVPFIALYNRKGRLVKTFYGETDIKEINSIDIN